MIGCGRFVRHAGAGLQLGRAALVAAALTIGSRECAAQCEFNPSATVRTIAKLERIAAALADYHAMAGSLPPAYSTDGMGTPLLSWRVLILPFLGEQALYDQFDLTKAWDDPVNLPLVDQMPQAYFGPRDPIGRPFTRYAGIAGPGTVFEGPTGIAFSDIADGLDRTAMVAETSAMIPWSKPEDIDASVIPVPGDGVFDARRCGPFVAPDGSVLVVDLTSPPAELASFFQRADGNATLPAQCRRFGDGFMQARRQLDVRGPVEIVGNLYSDGRIRLGRGDGSTITGDIAATDTIRISAGHAIDGDVLGRGSVIINPASTVSGQIVEDAALLGDAFSFPSGGGTGAVVDVAPNSALVLAPGEYEAIHVRRGATLTLFHGTNGRYDVNSFRLDQDATLRLDTAAGAVQIGTYKQLLIGRRARVDIVPDGENASERACFIHSGQRTVRIGPDATVIGDITALTSHLKFNRGTRYKGVVLGDRISLGRDSRYVDHSGTLAE